MASRCGLLLLGGLLLFPVPGLAQAPPAPEDAREFGEPVRPVPQADLGVPRPATRSGPVRLAAFGAESMRAGRGELPSAALSAPRGRLLGSVLLAAGGGAGGALLGWSAGVGLLECEDDSRSCGRGPDNSEWVLATVGMAVGAATGAHLGGLREESRGRFLPTLLAAGIGSLPLLLAGPSRVETSAYVGLVGASLGAGLADHLARRPR